MKSIFLKHEVVDTKFYRELDDDERASREQWLSPMWRHGHPLSKRWREWQEYAADIDLYGPKETLRYMEHYVKEPRSRRLV